jgi:magnesium transporter
MIVDGAVYRHGRRLSSPASYADLAHDEREGAFAWVGLRMPSEVELRAAAASFGWADLGCDELLVPHERPVLAVDGDRIEIVVRTARYQDSTDTVQLGELSVVAGPTGVLTVRFGHATPLDGLRRRLEAEPDWLAVGPMAVLASILGEVIDGYGPTLDGFERDAVEVERDVFSERPGRPIKRLYHLKRELRSLLLAVGTLPEPLARLVRHGAGRLPDSVVSGLQEAAESLDRTLRRAASLSNLLDAALAAMLAQISVQQNDDMRRISAWVAMAAGPTLIAGVYGMNFDTMPELRWRYGYALVVVAMLALAGVLYRAFRRSDWL